MPGPSHEDLDLSPDDYQGLRESPARRADVIHKVATQYRFRKLSREAQAIALEILHVAVNDVALQVRQAIVDVLKDFSGLPREMALKLAHDLDTATIAVPVIRVSEVFNEQDLLEIVATNCPQRLEAVAKRRKVSEKVSQKLVGSGFRNVIEALTSNSGAVISPADYHQILDDFQADEHIKENLALRPALPLDFSERLIAYVSEGLKDYIAAHHVVKREVVESLVTTSRERVTVQIIQPGTPASHIERMVRHLSRNQRLTDSIILRALCTGDIRFFEYALAERSRLPLANVRKILATPSRDTQHKLYRKGVLPDNLYPILDTALELYFVTRSEHTEDNPERFSRRVMERLLTRFPHLQAVTVDKLLEQLGQYSQGSAHAL